MIVAGVIPLNFRIPLSPPTIQSPSGRGKDAGDRSAAPVVGRMSTAEKIEFRKARHRKETGVRARLDRDVRTEKTSSHQTYEKRGENAPQPASSGLLLKPHSAPPTRIDGQTARDGLHPDAPANMIPAQIAIRALIDHRS